MTNVSPVSDPSVRTVKGELVSPERIRYLLDYDPNTGVLSWIPGRVIRGPQRNGGMVKCHQVRIDGVPYRRARVIWAWMEGIHPPRLVDHVDRDEDNNRWSNLRLATYSQNNRNKSVAKNSTSGVTGVNWVGDRWKVTITVDGKRKEMGRFFSVEEAAIARRRAEIKYYGEFAPQENLSV